MISFVYILYSAYRSVRRGLKDEQFRQVFMLVATILGLGTLFYWRIEHWSLVNSFYFSVVTLATVGFGDLAPTTTFSKLFTALYVIVGVGILVAFYSRLAFRILADRETDRHRHQHQQQQKSAILPATAPRPRRRWRVHSRSRAMPGFQNPRGDRSDHSDKDGRSASDPERA